MFPFPLQVELPDGQTFRPVKAFEEPDGAASVYRWDDTLGNGAEVVTGPVEPVGRDAWRITGPDGAYLLTRTGGCGCGHPLKGWRASRPAVSYA